MPVRRAFALFFLCAAVGPACAQDAKPEADSRARSVFERTRDTRATYSNYAWNWVRGPDGTKQQGGWSAEFHKGSLHRVEAPHVRIVADCKEGIGTIFFVDEGRTETGPQFANSACGINSNPAIRRLEWVDRRDSRFGPLDRIRVIDGRYDRAYAVSAAGALVASEFISNLSESKDCVQGEAMAVEDALPAEDIFSPESLKRSVVPEQYRKAPAAPAGDLWLEGPKCL